MSGANDKAPSELTRKLENTDSPKRQAGSAQRSRSPSSFDQELPLFDDDIGVVDYWHLVRPNLITIAWITSVVCAATFVITEFCMWHYFRAVAVLRPASQEAQSSMNMGELLEGNTGLRQNAEAGSLLGRLFGEATPTDVAEQQTILTSYDFTMSIVDRFKLVYRVRRKNWHHDLEDRVGLLPYARYRVYREITENLFDYSYDTDQGNLTIGYQDVDRTIACRVLQGYIDGLRSRLRSRAIQAAESAINALEEDAAKTSDSLLVSRLDQLIAQQLQQKLTAQMQADFAFTVVDPPAADDWSYSPRPLLDTVVAAVAAPVLLMLWLILRNRMRAGIREADSTQRGTVAGVSANNKAFQPMD